MTDVDIGNTSDHVPGKGRPRLWLVWVREQWRRHIAWHVLAAALVAIAALGLFAMVGEDVFEHESGTFDGTIRVWMLAHRTPQLFRIFTWVTNAGGTLPVLALTTLVCLWLWRVHGRHAASGAVAAPVTAVALFFGIKLFFARERPVGALHFGIRSYAFPSGHATVSMAAAVAVAYVLWREKLLRATPSLTLAVLVPLLVGVSRTYLDVHWATDVLGGWSVGLFVAGFGAVIYERLRRDPAVARAERSVHTSDASEP